MENPTVQGRSRSIVSGLVALTIILLTTGCGGAAASFEELYDLGRDLANYEAARKAADDVSEDFTVADLQVSVPDLHSFRVEQVCGQSFRHGSGKAEEIHGVVKHHTFDCNAEDDVKKDSSEKTQDFLTNIGPTMSKIEAASSTVEDAYAFAQEIRPIALRAHTWDVKTDLKGCISERMDIVVSAMTSSSKARCSLFKDIDDEDVSELRDSIKESIKRASALVKGSSPPTPQWTGCVGECSAMQSQLVGSLPAEIPVTITDPKAFPVSVMEGETITIDLMSRSFDSFLLLYDANCSTYIASNDDSGSGSNARIKYSAPETTTLVVVARSYSGTGSGTLKIQSNGRGGPSPDRIEQVNTYISWATGFAADDPAAAVGLKRLAQWQSPYGASCANAAYYNKTAIVRREVVDEVIADCSAEMHTQVNLKKERGSFLGRMVGAMGDAFSD